MSRFVMMAVMVAVAGTAQAGDKQDREAVERVYQKITNVDFEGVDVNAPITRPSLKYVSNVTGATFESLIKPRHEFDFEMKRSVDEIK